MFVMTFLRVMFLTLHARYQNRSHAPASVLNRTVTAYTVDTARSFAYFLVWKTRLKLGPYVNTVPLISKRWFP